MIFLRNLTMDKFYHLTLKCEFSHCNICVSTEPVPRSSVFTLYNKEFHSKSLTVIQLAWITFYNAAWFCLLHVFHRRWIWLFIQSFSYLRQIAFLVLRKIWKWTKNWILKLKTIHILQSHYFPFQDLFLVCVSAYQTSTFWRCMHRHTNLM